MGKATMDGVPDGELGWEASNGVDLKRDVRNEARRNEIKATFAKDVRQDFIQNITLKDVTYTCRSVGDTSYTHLKARKYTFFFISTPLFRAQPQPA